MGKIMLRTSDEEDIILKKLKLKYNENTYSKVLKKLIFEKNEEIEGLYHDDILNKYFFNRKRFRDIIEKLFEENEFVSFQDILYESALNEISLKKVVLDIEKMKQEGFIYEPEKKKYKLLN